MTKVAAFEVLNHSRYLYLRHIGEPRDNALRLVVQEAVVGSTPAATRDFHELPELAALRVGASPIESDQSCKSFELYWSRYEELVASSGKAEIEEFQGNLFRVYSKANFLRHLERDASGIIEPIRHYKLLCLDHIVDVASYEAPEIRIIEAGSPLRVQ